MAMITDEHVHVVNSFCDRLDHFLMERFDYKTAPIFRQRASPMVNATRKKFDLYFRVLEGNQQSDYWGGRTLVVSRIYFLKTRKGHGSALLKLVTDFAQDHEYELVGLERATTPSIRAFAAKYGFQDIGDGHDNYTVPVNKLITTLKSDQSSADVQ